LFLKNTKIPASDANAAMTVLSAATLDCCDIAYTIITPNITTAMKANSIFRILQVNQDRVLVPNMPDDAALIH